MMSKTHLTVGVAASLAVCMPNSAEGLFAAVIGGAAGGILCDIDCRSRPRMRDILHGRLAALAITGILLTADGIWHTGIIDSLMSVDRQKMAAGCAVLILTCMIGRMSGHRTFTHSLLYVFLITFGFSCIAPVLALPVLAGGLSHLVIDTLTRRPVPWLYPFRAGRFCLKLCRVNKTGNNILMWTGLAVSIVLIFWRASLIMEKIS